MEHPYHQFEDTEFPAVPPPQKSPFNSKLSSTIPSLPSPQRDVPLEDNNAHGSSGSGNGSSSIGNKVRLRAIESESEYFLKLLNVSVLRWLVLIQAISTGIIFVSQILLYANVTRQYYKPVDYTGIGIWGPIFFFSVASGLTWLSIRSPSGCSIGTAMGFQITSSVLGTILLLFSLISLVLHGKYNYYDSNYDPEVPGRVFCSFMILAAGAVIMTSVFTSVHFCRAVCCGRQRAVESIMFDVEAVK